jgi:diketogulonate reductase-like aldo/keto reductase
MSDYTAAPSRSETMRFNRSGHSRLWLPAVSLGLWHNFGGKVGQFNAFATARGQTLAQMALSWVLRQSAMTSVLIGVSRPQQIVDCVGSLQNLAFSPEECAQIDAIAPA